jgi:hypothetical protein
MTKKPDARVLIHFRFVIADSLRHSSFGFRHSLDVSTSLDMTKAAWMGQRRLRQFPRD